MALKEIRQLNNLTQQQAALLCGIPLRTYKRYEAAPEKANKIKYDFAISKIKEYGLVDESHGILSINKIKEIVISVLSNKDVDFCYLFGSYAKGTAIETSDVDLLISTKISGMKFYSLAEELRQKLNKKIDLLDLNQVTNNQSLLKEILETGVKIYG